MQNQEYIYVAGYPSFPDTVKIGMTTVCPKKRVADWGRDTGAPERPELIAFYPVFDARSVEKRIHTELANFKTDGGGTEWFKNAEHCKDVTRDIADIESALIKEHALKKREEELRLKEQALEEREEDFRIEQQALSRREAAVRHAESGQRVKQEREQLRRAEEESSRREETRLAYRGIVLPKKIEEERQSQEKSRERRKKFYSPPLHALEFGRNFGFF
ncbi:GIY-YIG nuclease family protein [Gammaproteobacteria bacterium]|nr:GIY-YIG nuclease family protein [Gammaproteobacteria bacterium]